MFCKLKTSAIPVSATLAQLMMVFNMIMANIIKKFLDSIKFEYTTKDTKEWVNIGKVKYKLKKIKKIYMGEMYKPNNLPYYSWVSSGGNFSINPSEESNPHMIIVGMSGFGKSTLLKSLIIEMYKKDKTLLIFDAHSEHKDVVTYLNGSIYDSRYNGINILSLDGMTVGERISEFVNVFKSMYGLGYIQTTKLSSCLWYCYRNNGAKSRNSLVVNEPTISDLMNELTIFLKNAKTTSEKNTLLHLKYRISSFNSDAFKNNNIDIKNLNRVTLFLTGNLSNNESRYLYMHELLSRLYYTMHNKDKENGIHTYLFIDEAQFLIDESSGESSIIRKLIEEGRKYGFGVIMATHMPTRLPKAVVANAATFITFYLREPSDISYSANILSGNKKEKIDQIKDMISKLGRNQTIILTTKVRTPLVVQTNNFLTIKSQIKNSVFQDNKKTPVPKEPMLESEIGTIVCNNRSERLVINNTKNEERWFMRKKGNLGIEHEVYVRKISDLLAQNQIKHRIIDNSKGPDISAYFKGRRIAIEYETGKKHILMTLAMVKNRREVFDDVVVIVNDSYLPKYKRILEGFTIISSNELQTLITIFNNLS